MELSLLFEDEIDAMIVNGLIRPERKVKYLKWISDALEARSRNSRDKRLNQYDKAEELMTWYTFAPLLRMNERQQAETLSELFRKFGLIINPSIEISFEKMLLPSSEYMDSVKDHPVRYIRIQIGKHRTKPVEGHTHIDCYIETSDYIIPIEAKFMSDISYEVKYNPKRNQIARTIDVCLEKAKKKNKKVAFMLLIPKGFDNPSRFYHYKMNDYQEPQKLKEDLKHQQETLEKYYHSSNTIYWSDTVSSIIQQSRQMNYMNEELESLKVFFEERNIFLQL